MAKPPSSWALKIELQVGCPNSFLKQLCRCSTMEQNEWSGFAETKVQHSSCLPLHSWYTYHKGSLPRLGVVHTVCTTWQGTQDYNLHTASTNPDL